MGRKKKVVRPIEHKRFVDPFTGFHVTVFRGDDADTVYDVPHWMNGVDFRKWRKGIGSSVDAWRNYKDEEVVKVADEAQIN